MGRKFRLILVVMVFFITKGYAKETDADDSYVFEIPKVIVTATKTAINTQDVPAAVEVITQDDIKARGAQILKDIIGSAAGISIMRADGRESLSIRGFDSRYCMILIDGKRIPAEPDANYELDRISLENVDRIEIVRGPVSSLYGADALGGVVNIITKKAEANSFALQLNSGVLAQNGNKQDRYAFIYDSGKQGKSSIVFSGSYFDNDASVKSDGTTYLPFGQRKNFSSRIEYYPTDKETFTLAALYMKEDTNEYAIQETAAGTIQTDVHDDNNRSEYSLGYRKILSDGDFYLNAYHTEFEKCRDTSNRVTEQFTNTTYGYYAISGLEARISRAAGNNHRLTFGGDFRPELYRGTGIKTGKGIFTKTYHGVQYEGSEVKTNYYAFYMQDEWEISPKLLTVASARYDDSNKFESNLSPKIGFTYTPEPGWRLKLNAGQGFRVPSPNQMYLNLNVVRNGTLVNLVGNSNLKPEDSTSYDFSVERDFGKTTSKLTYFFCKITDMIDEVWVDSDTVEYQNINRARIQGVEAEISRQLSDRLSWSGNYAYLDAMNEETHARLYNRARHKISSRFSYHPSNSWSSNLWVDSYLDYWFQPSANVKTNKSYTLWNMNVEKQISKNQTFLLGVENIFNHKDEDLSLPGTFFYMNLKTSL